MQIVAQAMSVTEKVALETKELHRSFFRSVFWDTAKNKRGESGLFIETLELPLPAKILFKIIKNWSFMRVFNALGFNKMVCKTNAAIYASSAAHGIITVEDKDENFVQAGRAFQRLWLESTRIGLSLQPVVGFIYWLGRPAEAGGAGVISERNSDLIHEALNKIIFSFGVNGAEVPGVLFRIGWADPPSARSWRKPPEIVFK